VHYAWKTCLRHFYGSPDESHILDCAIVPLWRHLHGWEAMDLDG
jgi:hypothetical protein